MTSSRDPILVAPRNFAYFPENQSPTM